MTIKEIIKQFEGKTKEEIIEILKQEKENMDENTNKI